MTTKQKPDKNINFNYETKIILQKTNKINYEI